MLKKLLLLVLWLGTSNLLFSQITISSPVVRQVFQRDLNSQALVTITGSYSQPVDTIQVRFLAVTTGQGTPIDWTVIKSSPLGGLFKGSIVVKGGWYTMEVRGLLNGKIVGSVSTLSRVGVGEVFVIAGQSNAGGSGKRTANETGATDDRVNCADFVNSAESYWKGFDPTNTSYKAPANTYNFSLISFSPLSRTSSIGPMGLGPYYWGKVGDALAIKLNVPIMFFNVAFGGSSVRVWRDSAENPTVGAVADTQPFLPTINRYDVGTPYANMKAVLGYYGVNLGVRAVLWMQGETDNVIVLRDNPNLATYEAEYLANLEYLIKKSRQDFGNKKLPWIIARTSYSGQLGCGSSSNNVLQKPTPIIASAQNKAISNILNAPVFPGPFTDNIQVPRVAAAECVHFTGTGLDDAATAWVKSLTEDNKNFFETVEPILADSIPSISLECISSSQLKLSLPDGYAGYEWVSTDNGAVVGKAKSVNVPSGGYIARVTRANGNIVQIPRFTVKANAPAKAPFLIATTDVNFCLGTDVLLQSSTEAENPIYEWTSSPTIANLPRTKDIFASREATYKLRVIDKNACASPYSTEVKLVAKPRPEKPTIATSRGTDLCDGEEIRLISSKVGAIGYQWNNGERTDTIRVKKAGTYFVKTFGINGCLSLASTDNITVTVKPLPAIPQIRALSDTVFCDGGKVSLQIDSNEKLFGWKSDDVSANTNSRAFTGTELVRGYVKGVNGCISNPSNAIQVVKKDNPKVITIVQKGTYTLAARADKPADEYAWKFNDKALISKDTIIRATDEGKYSVVGKNVFKVKSTTTPLTCLSAESIYNLVSYDDKGLSVYPNPSNGLFTLESRYDLDKVSITIYTMDGRLMYEGKIDLLNKPRTLDLSSFSEGMYILRVETSTFRISKMIGVNR
jgi:hypothetical protein